MWERVGEHRHLAVSLLSSVLGTLRLSGSLEWHLCHVAWGGLWLETVSSSLERGV